jgi:hypothetical protein
MKIELLLKFAYQYGPFFFAVWIYGFIVRWAYKIYNGATDPEKRKTYRINFVATNAFGIILVILSIIWWWRHQPTYVFTGQISELKEYESIWSDRLYFKEVRWKKIPDIPQMRDEDFVIIQEKPFADTDEFKIQFSKGEKHSEILSIKYTSGEPKFRVEFDDKSGKSFLKRISTSSSSLLPFVNEAQAQTPGASRTASQVSQITEKGDVKSSSFEKEIVRRLQYERTDVGTKILDLEKLNSLPDNALREYIEFSTEKEPMVLTLLDLSRHTDKELAFKANRLINERYNINDLISKKFLSGNENEINQAKNILYRMERKRAEKILGHITGSSTMPWLNALKEDIQSGKKSRVLIPTGSKQGDRYYVEATWDRNKPQIVDCLALVFKRLQDDSSMNLEEEVSMLKGMDKRLVFWYSKETALGTADRIERCNAKATFKAGY